MFFGYRIVAIAFLANFISVGFVFYSYGVFLKAIAGDFGGSRLGVSLGLTGVNVVTAAAAPFVGRLLDGGHARKVMAGGASLMGAGFLLGSAINSLLQFYLVFGLVMGVGVCMLGGLSTSTLVANWFVARRGTALGIATMGISLSGVLMPPIGTVLIGEIGWRATFLVYGAVVLLLLLPIAWLLVIHRPEHVGQRPDGPHRDSEPLARATEPTAYSTWAPLQERNFWVIAAVTALNFACMGAVLTHTVPHLTDLGFTPARAALVLSAMAACGTASKLAFGAVTDRMDKRIAMWLASGFQFAGLQLLNGASDYTTILLSGATFGFGMGGIVPLQGALVGAAFGRERFGRVLGLMTPAMLPISMLGVPFAGYIFDETGSYQLAFRIFSGVFALSMLVVSLLRLPASEPGLEAATAKR